jgi:hypothetical protein
MALPTADEMRRIAQDFCQGQGQFITFDKRGRPRGRTLGCRLKPDNTVEIVTFKRFKRIDQVRQNENAMIIWVRDPAEGERTTRVIFATVRCTLTEGDAFDPWYAAYVAKNGPIRGMSPDAARDNLTVITFHADEFRAEGFAAPGTKLEQEDVTSGVRWKA